MFVWFYLHFERKHAKNMHFFEVFPSFCGSNLEFKNACFLHVFCMWEFPPLQSYWGSRIPNPKSCSCTDASRLPFLSDNVSCIQWSKSWPCSGKSNSLNSLGPTFSCFCKTSCEPGPISVSQQPANRQLPKSLVITVQLGLLGMWCHYPTWSWYKIRYTTHRFHRLRLWF